jgi:hypothetical protein
MSYRNWSELSALLKDIFSKDIAPGIAQLLLLYPSSLLLVGRTVIERIIREASETPMSYCPTGQQDSAGDIEFVDYQEQIRFPFHDGFWDKINDICNTTLSSLGHHDHNTDMNPGLGPHYFFPITKRYMFSLASMLAVCSAFSRLIEQHYRSLIQRRELNNAFIRNEEIAMNAAGHSFIRAASDQSDGQTNHTLTNFFRKYSRSHESIVELGESTPLLLVPLSNQNGIQ